MLTLKIVTYNLKNGDSPKETISSIKTLISQGVDLFSLQEVRRLKDKQFIGKVIEEVLDPLI